MADDIIPLRRSYALSLVERISDLTAEVERLRAEVESLTTEITHLWIPSAEKWMEDFNRLRAADQYVEEGSEVTDLAAAADEIQRLRAAILEWDASTDCFWDDADSHDAAVQRYRAARAAAVKAARRG